MQLLTVVTWKTLIMEMLTSAVQYSSPSLPTAVTQGSSWWGLRLVSVKPTGNGLEMHQPANVSLFVLAIIYVFVSEECIVRTHTPSGQRIYSKVDILFLPHAAVDCGDLEDPDNGDVDFSSTIFKSVATYSCDTGFILVGVTTRVCQADGKWSGDAPTCERKHSQAM